MKKIHIILALFAIVIISGITSCRKKAEVPADAATYDPGFPAGCTRVSILQLKNILGSGGLPVQITDNIAVEAYITADDRSGNFYKNIMIQDSSSGIALLLEKSGLYNDYPVGRKIYVKCKGLYLSTYGGFKQLGYSLDETKALVGVPAALFNTVVVKANYDPTLQQLNKLIKHVTLADLKSSVNNEALMGCLIKMDSNVQFQSSQFCQDYLLEIHSPILKIQTQVTWLESQVLVKAAFPLNLTSETITYEVPCAVIERPTCPQTAAEKAKWEVSALHWADLSDRHQNYGVSLLNDCKYGYDGQPSQLRLTLLRSPNWPDPNCDRGEHHFTYALYPHLGDWKTAQTVRQGYQLNRPLRVYFPTVIKKISKGNLSSRQSLLTLAADNLCLMAFKRQENDPQAWILRLYEYQGQSATFSLQSPFPLAITTAVNLLEEETDLTLSISSWKIASFSLKYQND
jgi:hypothetical protein